MTRHFAVICFVAATAAAPIVVHAQPSSDAHADVDRQRSHAIGLYVTGAVLGAGGLVTGVLGVVMLPVNGSCTPHGCWVDEGDLGLAIGGGVALGIALVLIGVAIGLDADQRSRRRALDTNRVTLDASGLALAF